MSEESINNLPASLEKPDAAELLRKNKCIPVGRINETGHNSKEISHFLRILNRYVWGFNTSFSLTLYSPFYRIEQGYLYYYPNLLHSKNGESIESMEPYKHSLLDTNATKDGKLKFDTVFQNNEKFDFFYTLDKDITYTLEESKKLFADMAFQTLKQEWDFLKEAWSLDELPPGSYTKMKVLRWKKEILDILWYQKNKTNNEEISKKNDIATKKAHIITTVRNILYANNPEWWDRIKMTGDEETKQKKIQIENECIDMCNDVISAVIKDITSYGYIDFTKLFQSLNIKYDVINFKPYINNQQDLINFFYAITYAQPYFGDGDHASQIDIAQDHLGIFRNSLLTRLYTRKIVDRENVRKVSKEVDKVVDEMNHEAIQSEKYWIEKRVKWEMSADNKQVNGKDTFRDALWVRIYINDDKIDPNNDEASEILLDFLRRCKKIPWFTLPEWSIEYDAKFMRARIIKSYYKRNQTNTTNKNNTECIGNNEKDVYKEHIEQFIQKWEVSSEDDETWLSIIERKKSADATPTIPKLSYSEIDVDALKKDPVIVTLFNKESIDLNNLEHVLKFLDTGWKTWWFGDYEDRKVVVKYGYNDISPELMSGMEVQIVSALHKNEVDLANHTYVLDPMKYIFAQLRSTSNIQYANALNLVNAGIDKFLNEYMEWFEKKPQRLQDKQRENIKSCKIWEYVYNFLELEDSKDTPWSIKKKQSMAKNILDTIIETWRLNMWYFADDAISLNISDEEKMKDLAVIDFIAPKDVTWKNNKPKHTGLRLKDGRLRESLWMWTITNSFTSLIPILDKEWKQEWNKYISARAYVLWAIDRRVWMYKKAA